MTKTIIKDEKGELMRQRSAIIKEIQNAEAKLDSSMEQIRRIHYRRLGELFIQLRMTFLKGKKGDKEFSVFCRKQFPGIKDTARNEYIAYRKRLKGRSTSGEVDLPPLRHVTDRENNNVRISQLRDQAQYGKIVENAVGEDVTPFERRPDIDESELIQNLAGKIINTGYKVLAVKLHPDKDGGSNEAMRNLNKAKKLLEDALVRVAANLI